MSAKDTSNPWEAFFYEVQMYWGMIRIREAIGNSNGWQIAVIQRRRLLVPCQRSRKLKPEMLTLTMNAMIESKLIHIRVLAEIILETGSGDDDIKLRHLIGNWQSHQELVAAVDELCRAYGRAHTPNSPRWILNKMLAHFTGFRLSSYGYKEFFERIDPPLKQCLSLIAEIKGDEKLVKLTSDL